MTIGWGGGGGPTGLYHIFEVVIVVVVAILAAALVDVELQDSSTHIWHSNAQYFLRFASSIKALPMAQA